MVEKSKDAQDDYWLQSTQPLHCLAFVGPMLIVYEVGVACLGPNEMRNGADAWMRDLVSPSGVGEYVVLPLLACGLFLAWHHVSRLSWKLSPQVVSGMICESFVAGFCLVVIASILGRLFHEPFRFDAESVALRLSEHVPHMLSFIGAGIYEELLFRLVLLTGSILVCKRIGAEHTSAIVLSVIAVSLLFAAAHYRLFFHVGLEFSWYSFVFRAMAGVVFSALFLSRGIGIAIGAHAVYDILVAMA